MTPSIEITGAMLRSNNDEIVLEFEINQQWVTAYRKHTGQIPIQFSIILEPGDITNAIEQQQITHEDMEQLTFGMASIEGLLDDVIPHG